METKQLKQTPFYNEHLNLGGKMVDFAGWEMPVQYSTITNEHKAVRESAGLFDISHMGQLYVWGGGAEDFLQNLITNDIRKAVLGKGIYAHLLNDQAGVIDDIFVYRLEEQKFLVILNASRVEVDLAWMKRHQNNPDVQMLEAPFSAALALQGPNAISILAKLSNSVVDLKRFGIGEFVFGNVAALVARTGYTGEDGVEIFGPAGHLTGIWTDLFKIGAAAGLKPCGLGARDTLRTEVGYPLYGHELDEVHTPFQAGLGWVVKMDKGPFIGRDALSQKQKAGLSEILCGFKVESGGVARPGGKIVWKGKEVGTVASGTFGPTLGYAIGTAYLPLAATRPGTKIQILQGARELTAMIVPMPFLMKRPT